jgi:hypothetical protein
VTLLSSVGTPVRRIRAHKVILAAASPYFNNKLHLPSCIVSNDACSRSFQYVLIIVRKRRTQ